MIDAVETVPSPTVYRARRGGDDPLDGERFKDLSADDDQKTGGGRIRCPRCGWTPRSGDRWLCTCTLDSSLYKRGMCTCGHAWNTFDTRGRCPGCGRRWLHTQCLSCGAWSPHLEWYAEEPDGQPGG